MTTQLSTKNIKIILEAAFLANKLGVEGIILDKVGIRGYNDDEGIIIASIEDHGFEFDSLGLTRLHSLMNKSTLLKKIEDVTVDIIPKPSRPEVIEKLAFVCGKIDFEFRCALPQAIRDIPSTNLNKTAIAHFEITKDDVDNMNRGISAMRSKYMQISSTGDVVKFTFTDDAGDILNFQIDSTVDAKDKEESLSLTINIKKLLPIFKLAARSGNFRLNILKNNILYIMVDNMDVFIMPEVQYGN